MTDERMMKRGHGVGRRLLLVLASALVSACGGDTRGMPSGYGQLRLAKGSACPSVAGRYFHSADPLTQLLAVRHVTDAPTQGDIAYFELAGDASSGLAVTLVYRDSVTRRGQLRRGKGAWDGDYFCDDGWLKFGDGEISARWDSAVTGNGDFSPQRRGLWVAPTGAHDLVGRLVFVDYTQFNVWCGDGCKGFPIPWTIRRKYAWSRAEAFDKTRPTPDMREREQAVANGTAALDRATHDPVWQEEQALEHEPSDPELEGIRRRCLMALPEGVLLRAVTRRDQGYHLSLEFEELYQLDDFMQRLQGTGPVAELKVAPLYRAKTTRGHWTDVVYLRYER